MKKKQILLIIILSVITFVSVVYLAGLLYFRSHFLPGTKMNGVEVSFLNQEETGTAGSAACKTADQRERPGRKRNGQRRAGTI